MHLKNSTLCSNQLQNSGLNPDPAGFGIYVHWPFCRTKCPYCDFNSHVRDAINQAAWCTALLAELDYFHVLLREQGVGIPCVTSVFFGGGTPSLMPPETVAALIERLRTAWPVAADVEITLEANPTSVEAARLMAITAAGVNRLSLGVQALDDAALRFLGRDHTVIEAMQALDAAAATGVRRSFDLIYARPEQSSQDWTRELQLALALLQDSAGVDGDHLSLYQLTIEEGTGFYAASRRGDWVPLPQEQAADLYDLTQDLTGDAGLPAYEISNHARQGMESRHNLTYWRGGDYLGIGPGAHGRLHLASESSSQCYALHQIRAPESWLAAVQRQGHGTREITKIAPHERLIEAIMMGLRLVEGVDLDLLGAREGIDPHACLNLSGLEALRAGGFLIQSGNQLCASLAGRKLLNSLLAKLLLYNE